MGGGLSAYDLVNAGEKLDLKAISIFNDSEENGGDGVAATCASAETHYYMWTETDGQKGANEVISCVHRIFDSFVGCITHVE